MTLSNLLTALKDLLSDENYSFWSREFLISAINEAIANIVRIRKDANIEALTIPRGSNPIQLPSGTQSLITIESIEYQGRLYPAKQIDKKTLDQTQPNWIVTKGEPEFYVYELEKPRELWFYPKLEGNALCKISKLPTPFIVPANVLDTTIEANAGGIYNITIDNSYQIDIINYAMFRALSKESTSQKGDVYYKVFADSLGIKTASDKSYQKQDKRQDNE